jgi:predicted transcriptional regulator
MPYYIPEPLKDIATQVHQGQRPTTTVRLLLSWFGAQRRTALVERGIRDALNELRIQEVPILEAAYIDGQLAFWPVESQESTTSEGGVSKSLAPDTIKLSDFLMTRLDAAVDPTFRIGRLASANRSPMYIVPDATIEQATTLMLQHDFSQLPVMTSERNVKGLFSWKSFGSRVSLGCTCRFVRDAMDDYQEVSYDASIFSAVGLIVQHECVLVRDASEKISGIVTTSDLGTQFGQLGEPFLLLGEIENQIRAIVSGHVARVDLLGARDPNDAKRRVEDVADLTLGELIRLIEDPSVFSRLNMRIDRKMFVSDLRDIRNIRNNVMHFDPDGISEDDLSKLRRFTEFLRKLRKYGPR